MKKFQTREPRIERKHTIFEANRKNIRIINGHPFKMRYKGSEFEKVAEKTKRLGIATRIIGDQVFTETGRVSR
ncbi:MAG: hypothetical protein ISS48_03150 [Candidatus Aenigmarchaeota archaeon]|nr:hypothetical protein [Candidatus Aenigmarchaeota archaeon]